MTAKTPPAFPCAWSGEEGLTMRDYFAAKVVFAFLSEGYVDYAAKMAYLIADAMLKAREDEI